MEVTSLNNINIYNLSAGKSLPDWLSERKRRALQKNDVGIRKRIELIQDFGMPGVCHNVQLTPDGQYILATGVYKPRIRCFEVSNYSMKFERCFDSEAVKFHILSEDYSKFVLLQSDRFLELHGQGGRYYRVRIPKFGHDLVYHPASCDLVIAGATNEVFRLNLDQGKFLPSFMTDASSINVCRLNPQNDLLVFGTKEGKVEAWDPRSCERVGILDCALSSATQDTYVDGMPSVTALNFKDGLTMAVGTATGQILLYDIRSNKPTFVKDHMYGLPIKDVHFHNEPDVVLSMDSKILKIWHRHTGKAFSSIEPSATLNNLCKIPDTGMLFMSQEDPKILAYYIPALGPAPRWCSVLDSLTEELEESQADTVYDNYKFVTKKELDELELSHLIGTEALRAYMHGYFIDIRLHHKAMAMVKPFAYEDFRKRQIQEQIERERANRVQLQKLPTVNKDLAQKLMNSDDVGNKKQQKRAETLLQDSRFKTLFSDPDFQIDRQSEEYRLLNPVVAKLDKSQKKEEEKKKKMLEQFDEAEDEDDDEVDGNESSDGSSSDDDPTYTAELKRQHKMVRNEAKLKHRQDDSEPSLRKLSMYSLKEDEVFKEMNGGKIGKSYEKMSLAKRLAKEQQEPRSSSSVGGSREMTFKLKTNKYDKKRKEATLKHMEERKQLRRSVKQFKGKSKSWMEK
ncbi:hypothetical protein CHUAL_004934 [Chamberlinius hualienensis]